MLGAWNLGKANYLVPRFLAQWNSSCVKNRENLIILCLESRSCILVKSAKNLNFESNLFLCPDSMNERHNFCVHKYSFKIAKSVPRIGLFDEYKNLKNLMLMSL